MAATMKKGADIQIFPQTTHPADRSDGRMTGNLTGCIVAIDPDCIMVDFPGSPRALPAKTIVDVKECDIGRSVLLCFEGDDRQRPVILGCIVGNRSGEKTERSLGVDRDQIEEVRVDGERLVIRAAKEVVIQCGQAGIIMTQDGKVVIKGTKIVSRSKGINKIKGAAVSIN